MPEIKLNNKFKPLWLNNTRYFILTGGRASAKSFHESLFIENLTWEAGHVILFTRLTLVSAAISIIPEFLEKIDLHSDRKYFNVTAAEIENRKTNSQIIFRGLRTSQGNQTASLKSIQGLTTWVLDEAEELTDEATFDKIDESIRKVGIQNRVILVLNPAKKNHWIYKRFFTDRGIKSGFNGINGDTTYIHTSYLDNISNLNQSFIDKAEALKAVNIVKYEHRFMGAWIDEVEGALWNDKIITRVTSHPEFKKVCIAIDPSVTSKDTSDECGIICLGLGMDDKVYIFRDETGIYTPLAWCNKAIFLHDEYRANCIVAEINQGGDLVETVIHQIKNAIKVEKVWSKQGKILRAEPVVSLYEQGLVCHMPGLAKLEYEQTTWTPDEGYSPGRIDALVHGINYLKPDKQTIRKPMKVSAL